MASAALIDSNLSDLQLLSKGKVRDIYATSDPNLLLFVASDRISAYDVILKNVRRVSLHFVYCRLLMRLHLRVPSHDCHLRALRPLPASVW